MVDRLFSGARPLNCTVPERLDFRDFIWILISEEDKCSATSQKFWFRMLDIDNDGVLSAFELEYKAPKLTVARSASLITSCRYFYKEQQHRMEVLSQEVVTFGDMYCQMHDLVRVLPVVAALSMCLFFACSVMLAAQVKPFSSNVITLTDLRRCGQAGTFLNAW